MKETREKKKAKKKKKALKGNEKEKGRRKAKTKGGEIKNWNTAVPDEKEQKKSCKKRRRFSMGEQFKEKNLSWSVTVSS